MPFLLPFPTSHPHPPPLPLKPPLHRYQQLMLDLLILVQSGRYDIEYSKLRNNLCANNSSVSLVEVSLSWGFFCYPLILFEQKLVYSQTENVHPEEKVSVNWFSEFSFLHPSDLIKSNSQKFPSTFIQFTFLSLIALFLFISNNQLFSENEKMIQLVDSRLSDKYFSLYFDGSVVESARNVAVG